MARGQLMVTVGACSWWSTADRGSPLSAFRALPAGQAAAATPSLLTASGLTTAVTLLQAQARSCIDAPGDRTAAFSTDATAWDVDLLRAALGEDVVTFVGWSYGARLGAHYAYLFPARVRALVLDGPPDPQASPVPVIATEADPSTPPSGGVAFARALGPGAKLLTVSGGGRTAFGRSPCVVVHVRVYLVGLWVRGGHAC